MTGQRYADFKLQTSNFEVLTHVSGGDQQILAKAPTQRHRVTEDTGFSSASGLPKAARRTDTAIREHETHWLRASRVHGSRRPSAALTRRSPNWMVLPSAPLTWRHPRRDKNSVNSAALLPRRVGGVHRSAGLFDKKGAAWMCRITNQYMD